MLAAVCATLMAWAIALMMVTFPVFFVAAHHSGVGLVDMPPPYQILAVLSALTNILISLGVAIITWPAKVRKLVAVFTTEVPVPVSNSIAVQYIKAKKEKVCPKLEFK